MRSALRLISAGSCVGLYVPRFSRHAPSRFDCFSLTTMRYDGRFLAPVRINLIANKVFLPPKLHSVLDGPLVRPLAAQVPPLNVRPIFVVSFSFSSCAMGPPASPP